MSALRKKLIRLAWHNPPLQKDILPLLRTAQEEPVPKKPKKRGVSIPVLCWSHDDKKGGGKSVSKNPDTGREAQIRNWRGRKGRKAAKAIFKKWMKRWKKDEKLQLQTAKKALKATKGRTKKKVKEFIDHLKSKPSAGGSAPKKSPDAAKGKTPSKEAPKAPSKGKEKPSSAYKAPPKKEAEANTGQGSKVDKKEISRLKKEFKKKIDAAFSRIQSNFGADTQDFFDGANGDAKTKEERQFRQDEFYMMSPGQQLLLASGHRFGELFEDLMRDTNPKIADKQEELLEGWQMSVGREESQQMQGVAGAMGYSGGPAPWDKDATEFRKKGAEDEDVRAWFNASQAFTQAVLEKLNVKSVPLYRGIKNQINGEPPEEGADLQMAAREVSSWTMDPGIAYKFGRPVKADVPANQIMSSFITAPRFGSFTNEASGDSWGEAEMLVMGADKLTSKVQLKPGMPGMGRETEA